MSCKVGWKIQESNPVFWLKSVWMEHEMNHKRLSHLLKEIIDHHDCGRNARLGSNGKCFFFFFFWKVYHVLVGFTMDVKEARRVRDYTEINRRCAPWVSSTGQLSPSTPESHNFLSPTVHLELFSIFF